MSVPTLSSILGLGAVLLLLVEASPASAGEPAATPAQLIQKMAAAAREKDADGFLSYLTTDSRNALQEWVATQASLQAAHDSFERALDERFGKGAPILIAPPMDLKTAISRVGSFELLEDKPGPFGTAYLRVRTSIETQSRTDVRTDTFVAGQESGSWKLDLRTGPYLNAKAELRAVNSTIAALQNGKFVDRGAALLGLSQALSQVRQGSAERGVAFGQKSTPRPTTGTTVSVPLVRSVPAQ